MTLNYNSSHANHEEALGKQLAIFKEYDAECLANVLTCALNPALSGRQTSMTLCGPTKEVVDRLLHEERYVRLLGEKLASRRAFVAALEDRIVAEGGGWRRDDGAPPSDRPTISECDAGIAEKAVALLVSMPVTIAVEALCRGAGASSALTKSFEDLCLSFHQACYVHKDAIKAMTADVRAAEVLRASLKAEHVKNCDANVRLLEEMAETVRKGRALAAQDEADAGRRRQQQAERERLRADAAALQREVAGCKQRADRERDAARRALAAAAELEAQVAGLEERRLEVLENEAKRAAAGCLAAEALRAQAVAYDAEVARLTADVDAKEAAVAAARADVATLDATAERLAIRAEGARYRIHDAMNDLAMARKGMRTAEGLCSLLVTNAAAIRV